MPTPEVLLTARQVARYLSCAEETVKRLVRRGALPASRVGRQLRFRSEDVAAYLAASRAKPRLDDTQADDPPDLLVLHRLQGELAGPAEATVIAERALSVCAGALGARSGVAWLAAEENGPLAAVATFGDLPPALGTGARLSRPALLDLLAAARAEPGSNAVPQPAALELPEGRWGMVPLAAGGRLLGALLLGFGEVAPSEPAAQAFVGLAAQLLAQALDQTLEAGRRAAAEAAQARLALLEQVSSHLARTLGYPETLQGLAELLVPALGDYCLIYVAGEDDRIRRQGRAHTDPAKSALLDELERRYPMDTRTSSPVAQILRTGAPLLIRNPPPVQLWSEHGQDPGYVALWRAIGYDTGVIVPLMARGTMLGACLVVRADSQRPLGQDDLAFAEQIAQRAALAIDNARLFQQAGAAARRATEAHALLDAFVATAPIGVALLDHELRYLMINASLACLNGPPIEAHLGRTLHEVLPLAADVIAAPCRHVLTTGETLVNVELSGELPSQPGVTHFWLENFYPVYGADGALRGVGVIVTDITERKQAEAERERLLAREQAARQDAEAAQGRARLLAEVSQALAGAQPDPEAVLAQIPQRLATVLGDGCGVRLLSEDGQWLLLAGLFSYNAEQLAALRPLEEPPRPATVGLTGQVLQTGQPLLLPVIHQEAMLAQVPPSHHAFLERHPLYSLMIVPLRARGRVIGTVNVSRGAPGNPFTEDELQLLLDLADRAALAIDNARLYSSLQQALHLRETFLSVAAHELKTPLTSLLGQAQLLERRLQRAGLLNGPHERSIATVIAQTRRLNTMILALLDVSRLEQGLLRLERAPLDLRALVQQVAGELTPTLTQHSMMMELPDAPLVIEGDALRLEQVLQNLLSNAVKYSPLGGPVRLALTRAEGEALLVVVDQGIGIPAEALPRLGQRFYRAANVEGSSVSGMGIGLYVVYEIVTLHGGHVAISSAEGQGTTVEIRLPLREG
ncbi:MAG TPA: GAF domain-containing protein [Roseiflexaceae bacterium]|nr:GAF domain-containing protein [Roseiflexaceae bacterium]